MNLRPALLLVLALAANTWLAAADPPKAKEPPATTITQMVAKGCAEKPDWWDQVTLNYPPTLDLACPPAKGGWNAKTQCGVWSWDVINPNPKRWKEGTKFWHFVLTNAKQNNLPDAEKNATMQLGRCYGDLLQDWPRAIYWYQQAETKYGRTDDRVVDTANALWRLGSRTMALQTVKPLTQDATRHGALIKLYADLGEFATASRLAQDRVSVSEDIGWYMAGYTAQQEGAWAKALDHFKKAAASKQAASGRDWKQTVERAKAAIQAITLFETLDLKKVADGTYRDSSTGYAGPVGVEVLVAAQRITSVKVTDHHEKQYYNSFVEVPAEIIAKQHVKGVDATMGATITAEAIVYATAKALQKAQR